MRLIDADALLKRLQEQQKYGSQQDGRGRAKAILEVIHAPTIDAEPVKRGRWILTHDEQYEYCRCSECGYDTGENWMIGSEIKYCENCGARMDAEPHESEVQ